MLDKITLSKNEQAYNTFEVATGVTGMRMVFVNVYFVAEPEENGDWVLIDAGLWGSADKIKHAAEDRFGKGTKPKAIILTHGHFDHVGALKDLIEEWQVPVYAHTLEMPYLTGRSSYPPADPTVGGGAFSYMAGLYPNKPIDITGKVHMLPFDNKVPHLPGWRWIHTPGHTAGHVSFFRDSDRTMIVGDAFVTTNQESALAVLMQRKEVHGPPKFLTTDWNAAKFSVEKLAELDPQIAACGHGKPMMGAELHTQLEMLSKNFDLLAKPAKGRYVNQPAITNELGVQEVPPPVFDPMPSILAGVGIAALVGATWYALKKRKERANYYDDNYYHLPVDTEDQWVE